MKETGQLLKSHRESKNLSINEIAMATKINARVLIAIEDGNRSALPSRTFVRGFVVTYAEFLKLNKDDVLSKFNEETKQAPLKTHQPNTNPIDPKNTTPFLKQSSIEAKAIIVVVIIILIGVIFAVNNVVNKYKSEAENLEPPIENIESLNTQEQETVTESTAPVKTPEISEAATQNTTTEAKPIVDSNSKKEEVEAKNNTTSTPPSEGTTGEKEPAVKKAEVVAPVPAKKEEVKKESTSAAPEEEKPEEKKEPIKPVLKSQEIIIEALDTVELKVYGRDGSKTITLKPEQLHTIKAKGEVSLEFSDGGAVNIIRNGIDQGVPGDLGQPLKLTLPKK